MKRLLLIAIMLLVIALLRSSCSTENADNSVPLEHRILYSHIKASLDDYDKFLDSKTLRRAHKITFAAELLLANANRGPDLLKPGSIEGIKLFLDRLKDLGVEGVTVAVSYPLFLEEFDRFQEYVTFYTRVAEEVRARGMKLAVKAGVIFSQTSFSHLNLDYSQLNFDDYKVKKRHLMLNIIRYLKPDYLTIAGEPDTESSLLGLSELKSAKQYAELVHCVLHGLEKANTKIGAGIGIWGNKEYVRRFCSEPGLDFIVIHVYPVFGQLLYNIDAISQIARQHGKRVMITEAWLYKVDRPVANIAATAGVFRLDAYSFWSPLDQQFLAVLIKSAQRNEIEFVSPFWSTYFFAYVDYNANTARLSYGELHKRANREAAKNIVAGKLSPTGEYYKELIKKQK